MTYFFILACFFIWLFDMGAVTAAAAACPPSYVMYYMSTEHKHARMYAFIASSNMPFQGRR